MVREAEKQFLTSLQRCRMVETFAYLGKCYRRLDQPLSTVEHLKQGLEHFQNDPTLLAWLARIYEVFTCCTQSVVQSGLTKDIGDTERSVAYYRQLLKQDASNVEGIACLGAHFFYESRPEIALKFYRHFVGGISRIIQQTIGTDESFKWE